MGDLEDLYDLVIIACTAIVKDSCTAWPTVNPYKISASGELLS